MRKPLSTIRIVLALSVAVMADAIQIPLTAGYATGILSIFSFLGVALIDLVTFVIETALLGFHMALLPSLMVELIPGLDMLPTWTACVAYVIWRRKQDQPQTVHALPVIDIESLPVAREAPASAPSPTLPSPAPATFAAESRLEQLADLRQRGLITEDEYTNKRGQILGEL